MIERSVDRTAGLLAGAAVAVALAGLVVVAAPVAARPILTVLAVVALAAVTAEAIGRVRDRSEPRPPSTLGRTRPERTPPALPGDLAGLVVDLSRPRRPASFALVSRLRAIAVARLRLRHGLVVSDAGHRRAITARVSPELAAVLFVPDHRARTGDLAALVDEVEHL